MLIHLPGFRPSHIFYWHQLPACSIKIQLHERNPYKLHDTHSLFRCKVYIPGIWGYKLCSEKENAYRAIYMDCVRAVEFLLSRPEVDANKICVMGGSQGGGLTLATAGLCGDKIK